ncbi:MAG TPA: succinate dehydrogenase, hydrophobic membrane anchor protein [Steroidobacteraceae bacterium]|jgi:succinate dehydrogenase / fumarate reductase membrane anchor subunit|nr:succinate dehydrogenase, hydrophobic membrane anchor protein [Steroidobacteraceae bacterium]
MSTPAEPAPSIAARARGLGSARRGTGAWRAERLSAIALVPLTLWLVASLVGLGAADRAAFIGWLGRPLNAFLTILLLMAAFRHTALGLQVVIEDYVHSASRLPLLIATHLLCYAICVAGILATLSIVFAR